MTKRGFVDLVLRQYADMFEEAETVFTKPNVVSHEPYPTTTDPQVLDVVLTFLFSHRVVASEAGDDYSWGGKAGAVRHEGMKDFLGYKLADTDPVALDSVGFDLLQRRDRTLTHNNVTDVSHHAFAADCGVGSLESTLVDFWEEWALHASV